MSSFNKQLTLILVGIWRGCLTCYCVVMAYNNTCNNNLSLFLSVKVILHVDNIFEKAYLDGKDLNEKSKADWRSTIKFDIKEPGRYLTIVGKNTVGHSKLSHFIFGLHIFWSIHVLWSIPILWMIQFSGWSSYSNCQNFTEITALRR